MAADTVIVGDLKNKHLDSASSSLNKRNSLSSLSSGKASIQLSTKPNTPLSTGVIDDDNTSEPSIPERTVSSSTTPRTPTNQSTPRSSNEKKPTSTREISDFDIIADIIANATAAASSKTGTYSSLSSGKASIATTPVSEPIMATTTSSSTASTPNLNTNRRSALNSLFGGRSKSESTVTTNTIVNDTPGKSPSSRSSSLFNTSLFGKKKVETEEERELKDAGVTVKEIKGTLGKLVVPQEIANPMPKVKLEAPQHARLTK